MNEKMFTTFSVFGSFAEVLLKIRKKNTKALFYFGIFC